MRGAFINVGRPVSMEKTALGAGRSFRFKALNTVARSFRPPHSRLRECSMEGWETDRRCSLFSLPSDAVACVLEYDAYRVEVSTDPVRAREDHALAWYLAYRGVDVTAACDL